jgi:hypothetical protein|eukprot:COSAG06_NODE_1257_length_10084_cov_3.046770_6_plen_128_part_00
MSGRQPHGRTVRQDLKHSLPSYSNLNLFRDCATEQSQAAAEEAMRPPGTAGSARSDSARRALKLSVAAGSASLCVLTALRLPASLRPRDKGSSAHTRAAFFSEKRPALWCLACASGTRTCGPASRRG